MFRAETLLHHDRFSVHDVDALGGLSYALTIEVVNFMVHSLILHQCSANARCTRDGVALAIGKLGQVHLLAVVVIVQDEVHRGLIVLDGHGEGVSTLGDGHQLVVRQGGAVVEHYARPAAKGFYIAARTVVPAIQCQCGPALCVVVYYGEADGLLIYIGQAFLLAGSIFGLDYDIAKLKESR